MHHIHHTLPETKTCIISWNSSNFEDDDSPNFQRWDMLGKVVPWMVRVDQATYQLLPSNHKPAAIGSVTPLIFVTRIIFQNNIFKKVATHPDIAHPFGNSPTQLWKESLCSLLAKVARGVFQRCVETTLEHHDSFPI